MKHLDLQFYRLRDGCGDMDSSTPKFIPTQRCQADLLTKPLHWTKVSILQEIDGLWNRYDFGEKKKKKKKKGKKKKNPQKGRVLTMVMSTISLLVQ
jgi:hypothetical protein